MGTSLVLHRSGTTSGVLRRSVVVVCDAVDICSFRRGRAWHRAIGGACHVLVIAACVSKQGLVHLSALRRDAAHSAHLIWRSQPRAQSCILQPGEGARSLKRSAPAHLKWVVSEPQAGEPAEVVAASSRRVFCAADVGDWAFSRRSLCCASLRPPGRILQLLRAALRRLNHRRDRAWVVLVLSLYYIGAALPLCRFCIGTALLCWNFAVHIL